jgi:hypothetical protein
MGRPAALRGVSHGEHQAVNKDLGMAR